MAASLGNTVSLTANQAKVWQETLYQDVIDNLYFAKDGLMGKDDNNIVQIKDDLAKRKGDTINVSLTAKLTGDGVTGDSELEGNEEKISSYNDSVAIDVWRDGVRLDGALEEQRVAYNMRMDAKEKLKIRIQEYIERQVFLKMSGVRNLSLTDVNGNVVSGRATWSNSAPVTPVADEAAGFGNRYLCANYDPTTGAGGTPTLQATDIMTPQLITRLKVKAQTCSPKIVPLRIGGRNYYVLFIHNWQAYDLKQTPEWKQAMREGGLRGDDNPIFTGMLGCWDGVIIHEHEYVPLLDTTAGGIGAGSRSFSGTGGDTQTAANIRVFRASLCGQQAISFAKCDWNQGWVEKTFDYNNDFGVATGLLGGIQKPSFNSKPYGVINLDTAATKPA